MTRTGLARLVALEWWLFAARRLNWLVAAVLLGAMLVAAASGAARVRLEQAEIARAETQAMQARVAARVAARAIRRAATPVEQYRDPADPYGYLFYFADIEAVRPPLALSLLATGDGDLRPSTLHIVPGRLLAGGAGPVANPRLARIGSFDMAFVLVFLVPLALIAWAAPTMTGERDDGLLWMIAARPVAIGRVVFAKFAAVSLFALPLLLASWWLALGLAGAWSAGTLGSIMALSVGLMLYALFWIGLAAVVAARSRGMVASVTTLVAAWMILSFLLPSAIDRIAQVAAPAPSRIAAIDAMRAAAARFDADPGGLTAAWLGGRLPVADAARPDVRRFAQDALTARAMVPYREADRRHEASQRHWRQKLEMLSPGLVLQQSLIVAAGTDAARSERFARAADDAALAIERRFWRAVLLDRGSKENAPGASLARFEAWTAPPKAAASSAPLPIGALLPLAGWVALSLIAAAIGRPEAWYSDRHTPDSGHVVALAVRHRASQHCR